MIKLIENSHIVEVCCVRNMITRRGKQMTSEKYENQPPITCDWAKSNIIFILKSNKKTIDASRIGPTTELLSVSHRSLVMIGIK